MEGRVQNSRAVLPDDTFNKVKEMQVIDTSANDTVADANGSNDTIECTPENACNSTHYCDFHVSECKPFKIIGSMCQYHSECGNVDTFTCAISTLDPSISTCQRRRISNNDDVATIVLPPEYFEGKGIDTPTSTDDVTSGSDTEPEVASIVILACGAGFLILVAIGAYLLFKDSDSANSDEDDDDINNLLRAMQPRTRVRTRSVTSILTLPPEDDPPEMEEVESNCPSHSVSIDDLHALAGREHFDAAGTIS